MAKKEKTYTPSPLITADVEARYMALIQVLSGHLSVSEAARRLDLSRNHFQSIMHRAVAKMLEELQPKTPGPKPEPSEVRRLRDENERLKRQLATAQQQAEMFERFLNVASDLVTGRQTLGRRPPRPKQTRTKPTTTKPDPEEPDPEETRRRELLAWSERMRGARVKLAVITALLGVGSATLRRWKRRADRGELLVPRRGPRRQDVPAETRAAVEEIVRATAGQVGADSLRRSVPNVSRRQAAMLKRRVLTQIERERLAGCVRIDVTLPGVMRGFDAMHIRCAEGRRYVFVCADGAVPYRTTIELVERYDAAAVRSMLERDLDQHDAPLVLRLDRASCHDEPTVRRLLTDRGVVVLHGPPRHPRFYGQLERQNREHRAWLRRFDGAPEAVVRLALPQMQHALNSLWKRPSLAWSTAADAWTPTRFSIQHRSMFGEEVHTHAERLHADCDVAKDVAERLAVQQALARHGYLRLDERTAC